MKFIVFKFSRLAIPCLQKNHLKLNVIETTPVNAFGVGRAQSTLRKRQGKAHLYVCAVMQRERKSYLSLFG